MSNVIQFLEAMGSNRLTHVSTAEYAATVAALDVDDSQRRALLDRDLDALNGLLGGREEMLCSVWSPEEAPIRRDDDEREQDQPDTLPEPE
jgi:hypothetical protein